MKNMRPILLVEDDEVDALTVRRALEQLNIRNKIVHVENGEEALKYLRARENETPIIIFLDLNMPVMNGLEFLEERMNSEELRTIPTVVLTTSSDNYDKESTFRLSISGYVVKPVDFSEFVEIMKYIDNYWTISEVVDVC